MKQSVFKYTIFKPAAPIPSPPSKQRGQKNLINRGPTQKTVLADCLPSYQDIFYAKPLSKSLIRIS